MQSDIVLKKYNELKKVGGLHQDKTWWHEGAA